MCIDRCCCQRVSEVCSNRQLRNDNQCQCLAFALKIRIKISLCIAQACSCITSCIVDVTSCITSTCSQENQHLIQARLVYLSRFDNSSVHGSFNNFEFTQYSCASHVVHIALSNHNGVRFRKSSEMSMPLNVYFFVGRLQSRPKVQPHPRRAVLPPQLTSRLRPAESLAQRVDRPLFRPLPVESKILLFTCLCTLLHEPFSVCHENVVMNENPGSVIHGYIDLLNCALLQYS